MFSRPFLCQTKMMLPPTALTLVFAATLSSATAASVAVPQLRLLVPPLGSFGAVVANGAPTVVRRAGKNERVSTLTEQHSSLPATD
jgi:hypothetical protein